MYIVEDLNVTHHSTSLFDLGEIVFSLAVLCCTIDNFAAEKPQ